MPKPSSEADYRNEGRQARAQGKGMESCPYARYTVAGEWWLDEWRAENLRRGGSVPVVGELNADHEVKLFKPPG